MRRGELACLCERRGAPRRAARAGGGRGGGGEGWGRAHRGLGAGAGFAEGEGPAAEGAVLEDDEALLKLGEADGVRGLRGRTGGRTDSVSSGVLGGGREACGRYGRATPARLHLLGAGRGVPRQRALVSLIEQPCDSATEQPVRGAVAKVYLSDGRRAGRVCEGSAGAPSPSTARRSVRQRTHAPKEAGAGFVRWRRCDEVAERLLLCFGGTWERRVGLARLSAWASRPRPGREAPQRP